MTELSRLCLVFLQEIRVVARPINIRGKTKSNICHVLNKMSSCWFTFWSEVSVWLKENSGLMNWISGHQLLEMHSFPLFLKKNYQPCHCVLTLISSWMTLFCIITARVGILLSLLLVELIYSLFGWTMILCVETESCFWNLSSHLEV